MAYYLRLNYPLCPVYEIDTGTGSWKLAASHVGTATELGGVMPDGGSLFRNEERFCRVYPKAADGGRII